LGTPPKKNGRQISDNLAAFFVAPFGS